MLLILDLVKSRANSGVLLSSLDSTNKTVHRKSVWMQGDATKAHFAFKKSLGQALQAKLDGSYD